VIVFLDSSALVKRYHEEEGSDSVRELFEADERSWISELSLIEVISAFAKKVREGAIDKEDFPTIRDSFIADVAIGNFRICPLSEADMGFAQNILSTIGLESSVRTLDALIVSSAHRILSGKTDPVLWTFDAHMKTTAEASGLTTQP